MNKGASLPSSPPKFAPSRSAAAAEEVKVLINNTVDQVGEGTTLVNAAGALMQGIVASVQQVNDTVGEILQASGEQASGIEQVNRPIMQMEEVTQQNAALVEEAAAAAESMREQADGLSELVARCKLDESKMHEEHTRGRRSSALGETGACGRNATRTSR